MKILKIQALRGPTIWSLEKMKLIQLRLDPEINDSSTPPEIEQYKQRLKDFLPDFNVGALKDFSIETRCTIIKDIAIYLQNLAGAKTQFGAVHPINITGFYNILFEYEIEKAGAAAAQYAVDIICAAEDGSSFDVFAALQHLKKISRTQRLGPSTKCIIAEIERRRIPWQRIGPQSQIILGQGIYQKRLHATITSNTACTAVDTAANKDYTKQLLGQAEIPVPAGGVCSDLKAANILAEKIGFPVAVKPLNGNHGRGVSLHVESSKALENAFEIAQKHGQRIIIERCVAGHDFRVLVVNGKFVAAARRDPASVFGDGISTLKELIEQLNAKPERGNGHENLLTKVTLDEDLKYFLEHRGYRFGDIPAAGEKVLLRQTANLSTGGTATDITDEVHPANQFMAERAAAIIGLDICGIDIVAPDLESPLTENGGAVLEVNAAPGLRMHISPSSGMARDVAKPIVNMLFPNGKKSRIPLFAVTGTNGKTTTTRLLAHIARDSGYTVGYTTTDGIYVGEHQIKKGDCAGPSSASLVLREPTVDFAVLETARGGMLRAGLAFDQCDVGIITNIEEDHLGLADIETIEDLAKVKALVPRTVKQDGWAVLNAEDVQCAKIADDLSCNVFFFSLDPENTVLKNHVSKGGSAITVMDRSIVILHGESKFGVAALTDIPLTINGTSQCMTANVLTATAAAFAYGFTVDKIRAALKSFLPSYKTTPGRMNFYEFEDFKILVDYAHNPHGLRAMCNYLESVQADRKVGIIAGIGDRRDSDTIEFARIAAGSFDHIIVRQEHSLRGKTIEEIENLIIRGIQQSNCEVTYDLVPDEGKAIQHAMHTAKPGDFIVALSDDYHTVISEIEQEKQRRSELKIS